jgi:hypothetical protein
MAQTSRSRAGRSVDGGADAGIGPAAAQVARHRGVDILVGRARVAGQKVGGLHDLAGLAVAALRHLVVDPGRLNGVQRVRRAQPSIVVISPQTSASATWQDRTASPSIWTVQAPHCAIPQPYLTLVMFRPSRSAHKQRHVVWQVNRVTGAVYRKVHGFLRSVGDD